MILEPISLLLLLLLGAWSALDGASVGQIMISRPLVTGVLAGFVVGDPGLGLLVGGLLEAIHLADFPVGGVRLPEPGPGAAPAVAAAAHLGGPGGLAVGVALGVLLALVGGASMTSLRHLNGRIMQGSEDGAPTPRALAVRHWLCVTADGARGTLLTAVGLAVALATPDTLADRWPLAMQGTVLVLLLPAALPAGALVRGWTSKPPGRASFAAGLVGGLLLGFLLGA